jgi:hypothetical protein
VAGSPGADSRDELDYFRAIAVQQLPLEAGRGYETCPDCPRIHSWEQVHRRLEFRQVHFLYASAVLVAHHDRGGQCYVLYIEYKVVPVGTAVFSKAHKRGKGDGIPCRTESQVICCPTQKYDRMDDCVSQDTIFRIKLCSHYEGKGICARLFRGKYLQS